MGTYKDRYVHPRQTNGAALYQVGKLNFLVQQTKTCSLAKSQKKAYIQTHKKHANSTSETFFYELPSQI